MFSKAPTGKLPENKDKAKDNTTPTAKVFLKRGSKNSLLKVGYSYFNLLNELLV